MMSLSNRSSLSFQHTNHASSVYSLFSIATDLMTYWFGEKNPTVTAEVQSLAERMQLPEDVLWMPSVDQGAHLRSSLARRLTGPEGTEFQVNTYTTNDQNSVSVAALNDGGFVVTWTSDDQDGSSDGVYGQRYTASGIQSGAEFRVNTYTTSNQNSPAIAALTGGGFVVTWASYGYYGSPLACYPNLCSSSVDVRGQCYTASGMPSDGEFLVNTYTTSTQGDPAIAALTGGGFVVAWASDGQDGSKYGVYARFYTASRTPISEEFLVNTYTTSDQAHPAVAALTNGGFVVTWDDNSGRDSTVVTVNGGWLGVYGRCYAASGTPVSQAFLVNTYTTYDQSHPAVAALTNGGFVVVWMSYQDGSGWGVYGQRYTASGTPTGSLGFGVNTYVTNNQWYPAVAALNDGGFVVTWGSDGQDGSSYGVYGRRYTASGTPISEGFPVNTYTTSSQDSSAVAALTDGGFVVTWRSDGQDGSSHGVYGQRFDANGNKIAVVVTAQPSFSPSLRPTFLPTLSPTANPTVLPSTSPTLFPTQFPTSPSIQPTFLPTWWPTFSPTQSPTILPTWFPTYLPSIQPTESPTDQPKTSSSSLAVKDRIEALFTPIVILIAAASACGFVGLIACACFIVRYRQKTKARLAQPSFDLLPSADDFLASTPVHISPRDQRQECLREVELPTASFSGSASSPASVETSRQVSRGQLRSSSSAHVLPSTIPLIPSAELTIDYMQCLGEGGFGIVYKGTWQSKPVAVKQLKAKNLPQKVLQNFYKEAGQHGSLRHDNILILHGVCLDAPSPSMVMELMTMSLYYFLHSHEDFPWAMQLSIAQNIAAGLHYLHLHRTLHRDLKSHNVLLNNRWQAKLSDFGLSKTRSSVSSSMPTSAPVAGTLHWMAPEILRIGAKHTESSDVYALGMVFWEISSRELPFEEYENGDRGDLLKDFIKEGGRPTIPAATPPTFAALIARCWAQRAADRPVCADIVNILKEEAPGGALPSSLTLHGASTSGVSIDFADPMISISSI